MIRRLFSRVGLVFSWKITGIGWQDWADGKGFYLDLRLWLYRGDSGEDERKGKP